MADSKKPRKPRAVPLLWHDKFFATYQEYGQIQAAAKAAGVHPTAVSQARRRDPDFAARMAEIEGTILDMAESELVRRAIVGVRKGVWHQGVKVGHETIYSDTLLIFMLKKWHPDKYGDAVKEPEKDQPILPAEAKIALAKITNLIDEVRNKNPGDDAA